VAGCIIGSRPRPHQAMIVTRVLAFGFLCWIGVQPEQMTFTTLARGDRSRIEEPRTVVVRTPAEWATLWKQHGGERSAPAVDLTRSIVVGVFLGTRPTAGYSVEITRIGKRDADLIVMYRERRPEPSDMLAQVLTAPFHIVRTASHTGPVKFQRDAPR
jgi:hypothetical protein